MLSDPRMDELVSDLLRNNLEQIKLAVREREHEAIGEPKPPDPIPASAPVPEGHRRPYPDYRGEARSTGGVYRPPATFSAMTEKKSDGGSEGQVSEVSMMDSSQADTPIQPDQSVAGSPDDESGTVDEGPQGPNANPNPGASRT